ncbi:hypothetical protein BXP70_07310 [Hymenobacter crusticola]|uniref:DUF4369 domain-containing protein n=2 Tax=Hymenobacter crusticola TaxID=1770526 RepID=A0A243WGA8_9BACT|nr:hypothetical protein BXP70_07310 [Hymenobacter crusticola]
MLFCCLSLLGLASIAALPAQAQKVQDELFWTTFHKTPSVMLKPKYATYSVEYDLGNLVMNVSTRPVLQGLTYQKSDGNLLLRLTAKNLYVTGRKLNQSSTRNSYEVFYTLNYSGEFGYELRDPKTDEILADYRKTEGVMNTQSFTNMRDLEAYMNNAFAGEKSRQLLESMMRRADFALNPHDYKAGLTLNTVEGTAPAYADINKTTNELKALLDGKAPVDKAKVQALSTTWTQHLARANWEDKKSEINKRIASALLENLCVASLLIEDYPKLGDYAAEYMKHNAGMFSKPPYFETDLSYGGTAVAPPPTIVLGRNVQSRMNVYYDDLVADVMPRK